MNNKNINTNKKINNPLITFLILLLIILFICLLFYLLYRFRVFDIKVKNKYNKEDNINEEDDGAEDGTEDGAEDGVDDSADDGVDDSADDGADNSADDNADNSANNNIDEQKNRNKINNEIIEQNKHIRNLNLKIQKINQENQGKYQSYNESQDNNESDINLEEENMLFEENELEENKSDENIKFPNFENEISNIFIKLINENIEFVKNQKLLNPISEESDIKEEYTVEPNEEEEYYPFS